MSRKSRGVPENARTLLGGVERVRSIQPTRLWWPFGHPVPASQPDGGRSLCPGLIAQDDDTLC